MRVLYLLEYFALSIGVFLINKLPLAASETVARRIGDLAFLLLRARRRIAEESILASGITADPREVARIARESFRHFALLVVETLKAHQFMDESNWRNRVRIEMPPECRKLFDDPHQGVILVSAHLGSWEIAARMISHVKPVLGISKSMSNPYADRLMKKLKPGHRYRLTPNRDMNTGRLLAALRNGDILAVTADQHARKALGTEINFFGRPVSMHKSPALLHLVTRVPICVGVCLRTGSMQFTIKAFPPIEHVPTGNKQRDITAILEKTSALMEQMIRDCPEQYLWAHRRWRKQKTATAESTS